MLETPGTHICMSGYPKPDEQVFGLGRGVEHQNQTSSVVVQLTEVGRMRLPNVLRWLAELRR